MEEFDGDIAGNDADAIGIGLVEQLGEKPLLFSGEPQGSWDSDEVVNASIEHAGEAGRTYRALGY